MPGRLWYAVALAAFLAGAAGAALFLLPRIQALQERLTRVVVPATVDLRLERPGAYTIFHEPQSVVGGTLYHAEVISGLTVALHEAASGRGLALAQPGATTSYSFGGRSGTSIFDFEIAEPGDYRLSADYADGRSEPRTVLAVGQGVVGGLFGAILGALGIGLVGFAAAVAIAAITFLKRRSALRAAETGGPV